MTSKDELSRFGSTVQWHHRRNVLGQPHGVPEFKVQAFTFVIFLGMRMRGIMGMFDKSKSLLEQC